MTNPAHQAADRIAKALEMGPTSEWKSAREPNGRGHGWSAGPDAWLGSDAYSAQTAAAAAYIAACSPDNLRALLAERDELLKDAARYRLLRWNHWTDGDDALVVVRAKSLRLGVLTSSGYLLDEAVDAALTIKEQK